MDYYRDIKNSLDTAKEEGRIQGEIAGIIKVAKKLLKNGISIDVIISSTGLTEEDIKKLQ